MGLVSQELIEIWSAIESYKEVDLLVDVYYHFVNDIFKQHHIAFFV